MKEKIFSFKIYLKQKFKMVFYSKNNSSLIIMVFLLFIYLITKLIGAKI